MEMLKKQKGWGPWIADWIRKHWLLAIASSLVVLLSLFSQVVNLAERFSKKLPTITVGQPFVKEEPSKSKRSKHVRVPITAEHGMLEDLEGYVSHIVPEVPFPRGKKTLFAARDYPSHRHPEPGEESWSEDDKLWHLREYHFRHARPVDIQIDETENINVLVKIEGWDEANFMGNENMDELPSADTYTFTVQFVASNASSEKLTFTVVHADSYTDIAIK